MSDGALLKLKVTAYKDPEFTDKVADGEFTTAVNPEKYSFKYKIEQDETQAPGSSATAPKFNKTLPEELEVEFLFDRTGAVEGFKSSDNGIVDDIEKFKEVILQYDGDQHKPNYLMIGWGTLLFKGTLSEMNLEFQLFKSDGTPLRARAKAKFKGFVEDNLRVAQENSQSPDLTHIHVVKEGETLPWLSHKMYGDSRFYIDVARVNNLIDLKQLVPGQALRFPPLNKSMA
jgi:nucleoid-associated protein YgaU